MKKDDTAGLNNSMESLSKSALNKLDNFSPVYDEQWKYTNVNQFDKFDFNKIAVFSDLKISNSLLEHLKLEDALEKNINNCQNIVNEVIPNDKNKFILYNTAHFKAGDYFYLRSGSIADKPIYIKNIIDKNESNSFYNKRFFFHFDKNSSATIVLDELCNVKTLSNIVYEFYLEENSNIELIINSNKPQTT